MYVSPEEAHFFRELIVKFIVASGPDIGASEALCVMMYLAASAATDEQNCRRLPEGQARMT